MCTFGHEFLSHLHHDAVSHGRRRNPSLSFMAHLWEPLKVHFRPLAFYVGMELLGFASHAVMFAMGLRPREHHGVTYWICNSPQSPPSGDPLNPGSIP